MSAILLVIGSWVVYNSFNSTPSIGSSEMSSGSAPVSLKSPQWSGYVAMSNLILRQSSVTFVNGSWTVPSINSTAYDAYAAIWIGVGGYNEGSLIQTGVELQCVNGVVSYYAWYEFLPSRAIRIPDFEIMPGDKITASVELIDQSNNIWAVQISDETRGESVTKNFLYRSSRLSAEWVVEAPQVNGTTTTLANFGSATFSNSYATITNSTGTISSFLGYQLVMYDSQDVQLVTVSPLNADGSGFTIDHTKVTATP